MTSMITVQIVGLQLEPALGAPAVLLGETPTPTRVLPILIEQPEARSIALAADGVEQPCPGTHDLIVKLLDRVGSKLEEVSITELVDGVFVAELFVEAPSGLHRISARPSDAIALVVRTGVPISVRADLLDTAAVAVSPASDGPFAAEEINEILDCFQGGAAS